MPLPQLFNMAINASHTCFLDIYLDGVPKKINQVSYVEQANTHLCMHRLQHL